MHLVTRLPARRSAPRDVPVQAREPAPTHLLVGNRAFTLGARPLRLFPEAPFVAPGEGPGCRLWLTEGEAWIDCPAGLRATINGQPFDGTRRLRAGDRIGLAEADLEAVPIEAYDVHEAQNR
jgi:hypothetical protein